MVFWPYARFGFKAPQVLRGKSKFLLCQSLAHLSRRLTGELIVYPCSVVRRRSHFQRSSPLKPPGQSKPMEHP